VSSVSRLSSTSSTPLSAISLRNRGTNASTAAAVPMCPAMVNPYPPNCTSSAAASPVSAPAHSPSFVGACQNATAPNPSWCG
jgi:hypothetical protein